MGLKKSTLKFVSKGLYIQNAIVLGRVMRILYRLNRGLRKTWSRYKALRTLIYVLLFTGGLITIESIIFWHLEKDRMPGVTTPLSGLFWIVVFFTSGAQVIPTTVEGQFIALAVAVEGIFIFAYLVATIVTMHMKGGIQMYQKFQNHVIICGWTKRTNGLIDELNSLKLEQKKQIIVLADLEKNPYPEGDFVFISGDPTNEKDLKKAGVESAATAIILPDNESKDPDGKALLVTLAVETMNRNVYTIVGIIDPNNKKHFQRANADEIVCQPELGDYIVTQSCVSPRLSKIFSELLTFEYGNEIFKIKVPQGLVGKKFVDALKVLGDKNIIPIALERNKDVKCNPSKDTILNESDYLFVISEKEPFERELATLSSTL